MDATDVLSHEHRAIEAVLDTLEKVNERFEAGDDVEPSIIADSIDFLTGFADRCHHAKEEELLFPLLQERGLTRDGGPIGAMLHEHDQGRHLLREMRRSFDAWTAGDATALADLAEAIDCYTVLLRSHIIKEDQVLFLAAQMALSDEDNRTLIHRFEELEEKKIGPGVHERYHALLDDLVDRCRRM